MEFVAADGHSRRYSLIRFFRHPIPNREHENRRQRARADHQWDRVGRENNRGDRAREKDQAYREHGRHHRNGEDHSQNAREHLIGHQHRRKAVTLRKGKTSVHDE